MVLMVWLGTYAPSAPHYNQNRLAKTIFHSRLAFIHDWLSFTTGFHSWLGKGAGLALFLSSPKQQIMIKSKALKAPA